MVNQCCRIKSLGCNARTVRMCAEYCSGWLAVTCEAIIETRSAQGMDCNNAMHTHSLIILNHTHLSSPATPVFFYISACVPDSLLVCLLYSPYTQEQFLICSCAKLLQVGVLYIRIHEVWYVQVTPFTKVKT